MALSLVIPACTKSDKPWAPIYPTNVVDVSDKSNFDVINAEADYCKITDLTTPAEASRIYQRKHQAVSDIYKNSDIAPDFRIANKRGDKVLMSCNMVGKVVSDTDETYVKYVPFNVSTTITVPQLELVTDQILEQLVFDNLSQFYKVVTEGGERKQKLNLKAELRGAVNPL